MITDLSKTIDSIRSYMKGATSFIQFYYIYKGARLIPSSGFIHTGLGEFLKDLDVMIERARAEFTFPDNISEAEFKKWITERVSIIPQVQI